MTDLEIPEPAERGPRYRFFEILPGALSLGLIILLFVFSIINATLGALFVLFYVFMQLSRAVGVLIQSMQGYRLMRRTQQLNWLGLLEELAAGKIGDLHMTRPKWHLGQLLQRSSHALAIEPSQLLQAIIIPTYKEGREVLQTTIESILASNYPLHQVIVILAYEERAGEATADRARSLIAEYKHHFYHAEAVSHPTGLPHEIIGKGGNITYAGRWLQRYLEQKNIDPLRVIVTTLDADNHPDKQYLACLAYAYTVCPDPVRASFQPVAMYTNNIWDAPAPIRVVATGNSMHSIILSMRPHAMRNFSSHAQGMQSLIETDFWSVRTIVEDGHQFWRSYFRFDGHYTVYPLHLPIGQDAVLSGSLTKTLTAQFIQLRRWAYGASDVAYVVDKGFYQPNKVSKLDLIAKSFRLLEGHVSWAVGSILVLIGGFVPALFHSQSLVANQLPTIISQAQTYALLSSVALIYLCLRSLPAIPTRYKRRRTIAMVLQWVYLPVTTFAYNTAAAVYAQWRLATGRYMDKFEVTEKATVEPRRRSEGQ